MSVVFTAGWLPARGFVVSCMCEGAAAVAEVHATHEAARAVFPERPGEAVLAGCEFPGRCRPFVRPLDADGEVPDVCLSNANARFVLDALGLGGGDLTGTAAARDFLGRCLVALAAAPADAGVPPAALGRVVDLGRPAGYLQDRLEDLHGLAQWCAARDRAVSWA
ncbi:hypothetical protein [Streptomyces sp. NPDC001889]